MEKKYELVPLTEEEKYYLRGAADVLYRIRALKDFKVFCEQEIKKGDLGGFVESEKNLSQEGNCWIFDNAQVRDAAVIRDSAQVRDFAVVRGKAIICSDATIYERAKIYDNARIGGMSRIFGRAEIFGETQVFDVRIGGNTRMNFKYPITLEGSDVDINGGFLSVKL